MLVYQFAGGLAEVPIVGQSALRRHPAARLRDQLGHPGGPARPFLRARAIGSAIVTRVLGGIRPCVRSFVLRLRDVVGTFLLRASGVRIVLLELLEQSANRLLVHPFQAGQRERGAVADSEEHDRIALRRGLQLVVEQTLVHDADVLGREVGKVHRNGHPHARAPLPDPRLGAGQEVEHGVDVPVRNDLAAETRRLEDVKNSGDAVPRSRYDPARRVDRRMR